jgi:hypothetical protein
MLAFDAAYAMRVVFSSDDNCCEGRRCGAMRGVSPRSNRCLLQRRQLLQGASPRSVIFNGGNYCNGRDRCLRQRRRMLEGRRRSQLL